MNLEPPTTSFTIGEYQISINTGELLFPVIALLYCGLYYWDTRGLPNQSLLYAEPLLYSVVLFSVIVVVQHVVSYSKNDSRANSSDLEETSQDNSTIDNDNSTSDSAVKDNSFYNLNTATGLVFLSLFYVALLYVGVPFIAVTFVFFVVSLYMFGERNPLWLVGFPTGFTLVIWAVFINWLNIPLP